GGVNPERRIAAEPSVHAPRVKAEPLGQTAPKPFAEEEQQRHKRQADDENDRPEDIVKRVEHPSAAGYPRRDGLPRAAAAYTAGYTRISTPEAPRASPPRRSCRRRVRRCASPCGSWSGGAR